MTIDYFWTGADAGQNSFLSNFFDVPGGVLFAGQSYPTVEHAYHCQRYNDRYCQRNSKLPKRRYCYCVSQRHCNCFRFHSH